MDKTLKAYLLKVYLLSQIKYNNEQMKKIAHLVVDNGEATIEEMVAFPQMLLKSVINDSKKLGRDWCLDLEFVHILGDDFFEVLKD